MKKALSVFMSFAILASSALAVMPAQASDSKSATVEYSVCDGGEFTLTPTKVEVTADLSDKFAKQIGYNDNSAEPTILDATIAAHIAMFGIDFMDYAPFTATSASGTSAAFGEKTSSLTFLLNGAVNDGGSVWYNLDTNVKSGDYVEFNFYSDVNGWSDKYASFSQREVTAQYNTPVTLSVNAEDLLFGTGITAGAGLTVYVDGNEYGKTDENGQITITFDKVGTHNVTARGNENSATVFEAYCRVKVETKLSAYVDSQLKSGRDFAFSGTSFTENNAGDFLNYIRCGGEVETSVKKAFADSVYANLEANGGKLLNASKQEDLGVYGACILALNELGFDSSAFAGYNGTGNAYDINAAFEAVPPSQMSNPYYYRAAIEAASENFGKTLCDQFIKDYYVLGSGMNYWGYSCDNTAVFLASIAKYAKDYQKYVDDAKAVIASYTTDKGAYYSSEYPDENADSTATALMAFSALGDLDNAAKYYKMLLSFQSKTGVFIAFGEENALATKDSIAALGYYKNLIAANSLDESEHIYKTTTVAPTCGKKGSKTEVCYICGDKIVTSISATKNHSYSPKVTKAPTSSAAGVMTYTCKTCGAKFTRAISKIATTKVEKLVGKSKGFGIRWQKQTSSTGYQIRYSTNSNMKNAKSVLVTKNSYKAKQITGLKAKKKYYVQVRTYRVVNGKRYYSSWSAKKSVTTKK